MYGLPAGESFSFFAHTVLRQVCLGAHQITAHFDGEIVVTIEGRVGVQMPGSAWRDYPDDLRSAAADIGLLIDTAVAKATPEERALTLTFENGGVVKIYDSESHYESFQIAHNGKIYVI